MTTIDDVKKSIANKNRPNQFDFILTPPTGIGLPNPQDGNKSFRVYGKALSIPSVTAENQISRILTFLRGTALGVNYDNIIITFYDTKSMFFHRYFHKWLVGSRFSENGALKYYPDQYQGDASIYTHDAEVYKIEGMYPISVGDFRLENDMTDQYGNFDVTFFVTRSVPVDAGF